MLGAMRRHAKFAVLDCEEEACWSGHEARWLGPLARTDERWDVLRVYRGELPASAEAYDGYVITGSHHSVNDATQSWLGPLFAFIARCGAAGFDGPQVVGACFGAQVLGRALGGQVAANRDGNFIFGTEQLTLSPRFDASWFGRAVEPKPQTEPNPAPSQRSSLRLMTSHGEHVCELPPGAELLAHSDRSPHEIFLIGQHMLGVQCHAELTRDDLLGIILPRLRERSRLSPAQEEAALASLALPVDSAWMMAVFRHFLDGPAAAADATT